MILALEFMPLNVVPHIFLILETCDIIIFDITERHSDGDNVLSYDHKRIARPPGGSVVWCSPRIPDVIIMTLQVAATGCGSRAIAGGR